MNLDERLAGNVIVSNEFFRKLMDIAEAAKVMVDKPGHWSPLFFWTCIQKSEVFLPTATID